jgi:Ca2+-binding EF-hand superfamily protein
MALFKHFDVDNSDYITPDNIKEALKKVGKSISDKEISEVLQHHDLEKNGKISFDEFKVMMGAVDSMKDC